MRLNAAVLRPRAVASRSPLGMQIAGSKRVVPRVAKFPANVNGEDSAGCMISSTGRDPGALLS